MKMSQWPITNTIEIILLKCQQAVEIFSMSIEHKGKPKGNLELKNLSKLKTQQMGPMGEWRG